MTVAVALVAGVALGIGISLATDLADTLRHRIAQRRWEAEIGQAVRLTEQQLTGRGRP